MKKKTIRVTPDFLKELEEFNIFQSRTGMNGKVAPYEERWRMGDVLRCAEGVEMEEFSTLARGNVLWSTGAFTSCASVMPLMTRGGRYVCIADNVKGMGFRHPIEAVGLSSAHFNFGRENVHAYFSNYEARFSCLLDKKKVPTPQPNQSPITIGNDVWIGSDVQLAGGITIGDGAVIASGSLVLKDVKPYSIVAGTPAVHKKYRFDVGICAALQETRWWDYELGDFYKFGFDFSNPSSFIKNFEKYHSSLKIFSPRIFRPESYV